MFILSQGNDDNIALQHQIFFYKMESKIRAPNSSCCGKDDSGSILGVYCKASKLNSFASKINDTPKGIKTEFFCQQNKCYPQKASKLDSFASKINVTLKGLKTEFFCQQNKCYPKGIKTELFCQQNKCYPQKASKLDSFASKINVTLKGLKTEFFCQQNKCYPP